MAAAVPADRDAGERDAGERDAGALLSVVDVVMRFGGIIALGGVSFDVEYGQICGLIGPNGSGKTTLFNCISGFCRTHRGEVLLRGRPITGLATGRRAALGV